MSSSKRYRDVKWNSWDTNDWEQIIWPLTVASKDEWTINQFSFIDSRIRIQLASNWNFCGERVSQQRLPLSDFNYLPDLRWNHSSHKLRNGDEDEEANEANAGRKLFYRNFIEEFFNVLLPSFDAVSEVVVQSCHANLIPEIKTTFVIQRTSNEKEAQKADKRWARTYKIGNRAGYALTIRFLNHYVIWRLSIWNVISFADKFADSDKNHA